jgi:iron(III) transport system substrate-binding protein
MQLCWSFCAVFSSADCRFSARLLDRPHSLKKQGAPVDWMGLEPALVTLHPIRVVSRAPHSNAAKLFIDFTLSEDGQKIFLQRGRESPRPGMKPDGYPAHLKVFPKPRAACQKGGGIQ